MTGHRDDNRDFTDICCFNLTGFLKGGESFSLYVHSCQLFKKFRTTKLVRLSYRCM